MFFPGRTIRCIISQHLSVAADPNKNVSMSAVQTAGARPESSGPVARASAQRGTRGCQRRRARGRGARHVAPWGPRVAVRAPGPDDVAPRRRHGRRARARCPTRRAWRVHASLDGRGSHVRTRSPALEDSFPPLAFALHAKGDPAPLFVSLQSPDRVHSPDESALVTCRPVLFKSGQDRVLS